MRRPEIPAALAADLVRSQFPEWADLPVTPVELDGWDNRTFRLGRSMLVRMPSAEGYVAQIEKEHRWLPYLAARLPVPIPAPIAMGQPGSGYPWPWSVYGWIPGEPALAGAGPRDQVEFATDVADFLRALEHIDATGGPAPGAHNFYRGGPISTYAREAREAALTLKGVIDTEAALDSWAAAEAAPFDGPPVWIHGDIAPGNLLLRDGKLSGVIDFGTSGVGDPACDLAIGWTSFSRSTRATFRARLGVDDGTWARGRAWALWKALIVLRDERVDGIIAPPTEYANGWKRNSLEVIEEILSE